MEKRKEEENEGKPVGINTLYGLVPFFFFLTQVSCHLG